MSVIQSQRHRFSIPPEVHYLNNADMAPLSHEVVAAMEQAARRLSSRLDFPMAFLTA